MIKLVNAEKHYKQFDLNCSLEVRPGQITGLIGENGAGKSTTFKLILDLIHIGLVSELMKQGVKLLLIDIQSPHIHFADEIFNRDKRLDYEPINIDDATVITCSNSRSFLHSLGIEGEIISTPSHSNDSISIILDGGTCFVGDLEPIHYLEAYDNNIALKKDWELIISYNPKTVLYAHINEKHRK